VDAVCSHGQTVYHWVDHHGVAGARALGSLQLGQPGGPLAWDTGPANALIDAAVLRTGAHPAGYDVDGALAARGRVDEQLLTELLAEPYYHLPPPKSTGKELFHDGYLDAALARPIEPADLVATLTALTARTVADAVRGAGVDTLVVSGGGAANPTLMAMLGAELPGVRLVPSADLGAPRDAKEAIAFALIGWQTLHGLPATLPSCTGASGPRVLGTITPGAGRLRLPESATVPRALRLSVAEEAP
jgi:anhydro-N-acetylmuramic acid kinase